MSTVLWILLEGSEAQKTKLTSDLKDLSDLASYLVRTKPKLQQTQIDDSDLIFFYFNTVGQNLPRDITLEEVEQNTSGKNPLVVRYPLSTNTVVINLRFLNATEEIRLPHNTGAWHMLLAKTKAKYQRLQEDNEFYFVDQETKKTTIDDEFTFNDLVKDIKPNSENKIIINLLVRMKGKKPYGEWTTKDMLRDILQNQYSSINEIPEFNIDDTFGTTSALDDEESRHFTNNLSEIKLAFHGKVNTNEATARQFINPFMVKAVAKVISKNPLIRLAVEEDFDGSRGYGRLDYVVFCEDLAVLVTEAKMTEMQSGIAQNIVQLHTAAEKKRKRGQYESTTSPSTIYGIVSTGKSWQFLRWLDKSPPSVEISKEYDVPFGGDFEKPAKHVLSIITHLLELQASGLTPQVEAEERPTQRMRHD